MKKLLVLSVIFAAFLITGRADAQTAASGTDRALFNLKESVSELVAAKDKNDKNSLAYRIVAFKQVIDLSLAESEQVRMKLANIIPNEHEKEWYDGSLASLQKAIVYFRTQRKSFNNLQVKSIEEIKMVAEKFKLWRELNYLQVIEATTDFIAVKEAESAYLTAEARRQKIEADLDSVPIMGSQSRARALGELTNLLIKSRGIISSALKDTGSAYSLFEETYLLRMSTSTTSTTAIGAPTATSGASTAIMPEVATSTATTTAAAPESQSSATGTSSSSVTIFSVSAQKEPETLPFKPSIKDLVRNSLINVQESYRIFIEMSRVVRTLL